jgi:hypothetical protein
MALNYMALLAEGGSFIFLQNYSIFMLPTHEQKISISCGSSFSYWKTSPILFSDT